MQETRIFTPSYSKEFRCIGPACEDSCCSGWRVDIDKATYDKYQTVPAGPLRSLIDATILPAAQAAGVSNPALFAQVKLSPSLDCPFHTADRLCRIQAELGHTYLSETCAQFPRIVRTIDRLEEKSLALSCPEAVRLILNQKDLPAAAASERAMTWDDAARVEPPLRFYFWPVRELAVRLLRNRAYPLWQRMFLLGTFSRRMGAVASGELDRKFPAVLRDFTRAVESGSLAACMETLPADLPLQLDLVAQFVQLRIGTAKQRPRVVETVQWFLKGIGHDAETTLNGRSARYADAYRRYYTPFFQRNPHVLENYLIDTVFRRLFPFGSQLFDRSAPVDPAREFALLAIEFALTKGLLIGVAGCHKEEFSMEHVVHTVQTAYKHFEHNTGLLTEAYELLEKKNLAHAAGLTMLLRN